MATGMINAFEEISRLLPCAMPDTKKLSEPGSLLFTLKLGLTGLTHLKGGLGMTLSRGSSQRDRARERQHQTHAPFLGENQQNGMTFHLGGRSRGPIGHRNGQGHLASSGRTGLK